ncbi:hypothetical protein ACMXYN_03755 [Neptuniibacter sp. PT8_73]|uniref:hypothetical protein n=1 Tax=Neptuniibacter sp. PT8_73 TaxID=3398206 RepID=UPI0039F58884
MKSKTLLFKTFAVLGLLLCLIGIYVAVTWVMGDLYGYKVRFAVESWQKEKALPELGQIDKALIDAEGALTWEDTNPEYYELKARVLYYKALVEGVDGAGRDALVNAKQLHIQAAELRPRWPYSWANIVLMKAHMNEFDEEFNQSLLNAEQYGPWEQSVHLTLAHAGAISWSNLSAEQKSIIAEHVHRGLKHSFKGLADILNFYKKRSLICAYMQRDEKQKVFCGS